MKYNGCEIKQNKITKKYGLYDVFTKTITGEEYNTLDDAKDAVDALLLKNRLSRYQPIHSGRYWWSVIDKRTQQYVKKEDNKPLSFKTREECVAWCDEHN